MGATMSKNAAPTKPDVLPEVLAELRERAKAVRERFKDKPGPDQLLAAQERADAAPFYFELRAFVKQLRSAREAAGLTLA
jgi:hypothetical protein